MGQDKSQTI